MQLLPRHSIIPATTQPSHEIASRRSATQERRARHADHQVRSVAWALVLGILLAGGVFAGEDITTSTPAALSGIDTNGLPSELLRHYLELQGQLHTAQRAIERNRQEAADAANRNAEAIAARIQSLERTLTNQRESERRQLDDSNRLIFMIGGSCVALGFIATLLTAYFQWRTVSRLTEFSMVSQASLTIGRNALPAAVGATHPAIDQANGRLNDALARVEQKIRELEQHTRPSLHESTVTIGDTISASTNAATISKPEQVAVLIAKGQSLLELDKAEEALTVFNDILALEPHHTDTLVKKGDTLERLGRSDEAITCYDAAIATDSNFTIAYLHKGGLFNRLDRHEEALKCYEEALRTQEKQ